ncbi:MAG: hypothetical protein Q9228_004708 [Teloschistes exilis]
MGLSGPRKRAKFSQDPNNTVWTRSPSNFGQKVLLSQGWKPGSALGAQDASYTDSPGSLSHIKVTSRDENLGLGARSGVQGGEDTTTGLDGLQDLLGRLNGKTQSTRRSEQESRKGTRKVMYAHRRWGNGNFVSGGFLVGDGILHGEAESSTEIGAPQIDTTRSSTTSCSEANGTQSRRKKKKRAVELIGTFCTDGSRSKPISSADNHSKTQKSQEKDLETKELRTIEEHVHGNQRRSEKAETKAKGKSEKAEKAAAKALRLKQEAHLDTTSSMIKQLQSSAGRPKAADGEKMLARHAVRRRFIQHKQKSLTDQKALNEILMIRT